MNYGKGEAFVKAAALDAFVAAVDGYCWHDMGPTLTCSEVEAFIALLEAAGDYDNAKVLLQAHRAGDDDETDLH
jgi:hypothetical protein